jgi:HSP20 family protein
MARRTHFFVQTFRAPAPEFQMSWTTDTQWQPRVDIYQNEAEILILVEAAGVREDDLKMYFENNSLVIEGRRERPDVTGDAPCAQGCLQVEIAYGAFHRVLALPRDIDHHNIRAHYENGMLKINVPRRTREAMTVKINVE